jgi:hypothetical protein
MKNPKRRLGAKGLDDIKRHPFFGPDMDWDAIAQKRVPAPIKPKLKDEMDTSNFAEEFTRLPITDSPGLAPPTESIFRVSVLSFTVLIYQWNLSPGLLVYFANGSLWTRECSQRRSVQSPSSN